MQIKIRKNLTFGNIIIKLYLRRKLPATQCWLIYAQTDGQALLSRSERAWQFCLILSQKEVIDRPHQEDAVRQDSVRDLRELGSRIGWRDLLGQKVLRITWTGGSVTDRGRVVPGGGCSKVDNAVNEDVVVQVEMPMRACGPSSLASSPSRSSSFTLIHPTTKRRSCRLNP